MKILAEITERSLGIGANNEVIGGQYTFRKSARGIILNDRGEMAVQHLRKYDFYKLPGGGVEKGESIEEALKREILEEVGCAIDIVREIGVVIEYRDDLLQILFCLPQIIHLVKGPARDDSRDRYRATEGGWRHCRALQWSRHRYDPRAQSVTRQGCDLQRESARDRPSARSRRRGYVGTS